MPKLNDATKTAIREAMQVHVHSGIPEEHLARMCADHAIGLLELDHKVTAGWYEDRVTEIIYRLRRDLDNYTSTEFWTSREEAAKELAERELYHGVVGMRVIRVRRTAWKKT